MNKQVDKKVTLDMVTEELCRKMNIKREWVKTLTCDDGDQFSPKNNGMFLIVENSAVAGVRGTSTIDPQQMLIFRELLIFRITKVGLIFLVSPKRLTYHVP